MDVTSEGSAARRFLRNLEVTQPKGSTYAITTWVNADLIPMDSSRRTWNGWKYVVYWATGGKPVPVWKPSHLALGSLIVSSDVSRLRDI